MKIAALCSTYFPLSHADVIVSRWLEARPSDAKWGWQPRSEIAALFVDQFPPNDLSREKSARFGVPIFGSIKETLCLGGKTLAVDAVLLIGEHGDYPLNHFGQKLYPRAEWFAQIASVFQLSGGAVPVWNDKALSWSGALAREVIETARVQNIPLMAGSSAPLCGFDAPFPFENQPVSDAVSLFYGGPEIYGFHSLELSQSALEQRLGNECGLESVVALEGADVWRALDEGEIAIDLFELALQAARYVEAGNVRLNCRDRTDLDAVLSESHIRGGVTATAQEFWPRSPLAFLARHRDGLRVAHVMLEGHLGDYCVAARSGDRTWAARMDTSGAAEFHPHFAIQNAHIETFFRTRIPAAPLERTFFSTLATEKWMHALQNPKTRLETPNWMMEYAR